MIYEGDDQFLYMYFEAGYKNGFERGIVEAIRHTIYHIDLESMDQITMVEYDEFDESFANGFEMGFSKGYLTTFKRHQKLLDELKKIHKWKWVKNYLSGLYKTNSLFDINMMSEIHKYY